MTAPARDLEAWIASASARLDELGWSVEVKRTPTSAVLRCRPLRLVMARTGGTIPIEELEHVPDGDHLDHRPAPGSAAVLTLYRSGTAMWQGEPNIRAEAREALPDSALGASKVSAP